MFAALYPGQGSQAVGMGRYLYDNFSVVKQLFEESSDILHIDFKDLCFNGPEADLAQTANTQPALLLVSVAAFRALYSSMEAKPQIAAGHSVGEYAACVNANVLSFSSALRAVRERGQAMQSAVPQGRGGMAAVMGLDSAQTKRMCDWAVSASKLSPLEPANYNAPGQIVISGNQKAIEWLVVNYDKDLFAAEGNPRVKFIPLKVSAPFHCSMMKPAEDQMRRVLERIEFQNSSHPIVQNFTAEAVTESHVLRANLVSQISGAVRWIECVQVIKNSNPKFAVEFGHSQVIKGLVKKINAELQVHTMNSLEEFKALEEVLKRG